MAVITLPNGPSLKFKRMTFGLERSDAALERFDGSTQITSYIKNLWRARIVLPMLTEAELRDWSAALSQLSSFANSCELTPPDYETPAYGGNVPRVNGASQTGRSLVCDNVTASTLILRKGDWFDVATGTSDLELKKMTSDATSDGSGNVTLNFEPALRHSPADNVDTRIVNPRARFRLAEPNIDWETDKLRYGNVEFDLREMVTPE